MRKHKFLALSLLAGLAGALSSCSNDSELIASSVEGVETAAQNAKLVFTIAAPTAGNIITRDDSETSISTLNVYVFGLSDDATASTATDDNYTLLTTISEFTSDGTGNVTCSADIDETLSGQTIRALVVANDAATLTDDTSTITDLKSALATASVSDGDYASTLVSSGFPMSAEAEYDDDATYVELSTESTDNVELTATLTRTVARVDIYNYYDGLTVDDVYITNVANASYLFAQSSTDAPTSASYISLKPVESYFSDSVYTAWSFTSSTEEDTTEDSDSSSEESTDDTSTDNDSSDSTDETTSEDEESDEDSDSEEYVAHEGEFYLYEQSSATYCPTVYIAFHTSDSKYASVAVPFTNDDENVDVERNHIYVIKLGVGGSESSGNDGGTTTSTSLSISFSDVSDWGEGETTQIDVTISSTDDSTTEE